MDLSNLEGYDEAIKAVQRATSARMQHLTKLDRYVEGTQYLGRPDWFSTEKPLFERAPCVVYPIVRSAIDSNTDLVLGEGRFPSIAVPSSDDVFDDAGVSEDEAKVVNRWLVELENHARLRAVAREVFQSSQSCGSACAVVALRRGTLVVDTLRASWCTPKLDANGDVLELVVEYPFLRQLQRPDGKWGVEAMLYRRTIDAQKDITFKPAKLENDAKPKWTVDVEVTHGLGFCPVVWYAHAKGCSTVADVDGHAIHEHLTDEITALDFALSQKHRAALYAGDPQWTECGVEAGSNPSSAARMPMSMPATMTGGPVSAGNPVTSRYADVNPRGNVRKKSPGDVWQYAASDVKVQLHALPGDALDSIDKHARDLKTKISEGLGVVFIDLQEMHAMSSLSGRTLDALRSRQLDRCDSYRADFGDKALRPIVTMLMRMVATRPLGLRVPGIAKVRGLLVQILERGILLRLDWGPYSRPEPEEALALVQMAVQAKEGGLATKRSAVVMVKDVLGIDDVDEHMAKLEEESAKAMKQAQDMAVTAAKESDKPDDDNTPDKQAEPEAQAAE